MGCKGSSPEDRAKSELTKSVETQSHGLIKIQNLNITNTIPVGSAGTECKVVAEIDITAVESCYWGDGMAGTWYGKFPAAKVDGDAWQRTRFAFFNNKGESRHIKDYNIPMIKSANGWIIKEKSDAPFSD